MKFLKMAPVAVVIGAIIYLMSTSFQEALSYYVTVSEMNSNMNRYRDKTLKVAGFVVKGSIEKRANDPLWMKFRVHESGQEMTVEYRGLAPDTFKDDAEVVVTGRWTNGVFQGTEILAKCASKYQEKVQP